MCAQCEEKKIRAGLSVTQGACKEQVSDGSFSSSRCGPQAFHCKSDVTE